MADFRGPDLRQGSLRQVDRVRISQDGIEFWASARDCLVEGCRLWLRRKVGPDQFAEWCARHRHDRHSLVADPQFVAPAGNDYRLAADSPARKLSDHGQPAGALP